MKIFTQAAGRLSLVLLLACCVHFSKVIGQSLQFGREETKFEVGLNIGPSFFLGDLGGHAGEGSTYIKDLNLNLTKVMVGAFAAVYPNEWLGFRVAGNYGKIAGQDRLINTKGEDELWRKQRNLDFRSDILEGYVATEIFPLMLLNSGHDDYQPRFRPYGVMGVGMFHFNPKGSLTDVNGNTKWYYLQPLHTEGEGFDEYPDRKNYKLTQVNIPLGFGGKFLLSERMNISLECLWRKTFTDYIDDVSTEYIDPVLFDKYLTPENAAIAKQIHDKVVGIVVPSLTRNSPDVQRGNPNQNDNYFTFTMKLGIRLGSVYEGSRNKRAMSQMRCPHRF